MASWAPLTCCGTPGYLRRSGELVRTAASSGSSLMSILNDVLDHSKIEAGKLTLSKAPLSLGALASSVIALFQGNADRKGLDLSLVKEPDVDVWVIADGQRLKQVLLNLVGNALKFTESGRVSLLLSLQHVPTEGTARVRFVVSDTGIGMTERTVSQLFQPFQQADGSRSRRQRRDGPGSGDQSENCRGDGRSHWRDHSPW